MVEDDGDTAGAVSPGAAADEALTTDAGIVVIIIGLYVTSVPA